MATALQNKELARRRHSFSVDDFYEMARAGILKEDDRVELIEGEIIAMNPIGPTHAYTVDALAKALIASLGDKALVRVQNPVRVDGGTEPQPDIAVVKPLQRQYIKRHPRPGDVFFLIEVADSSREFDREVKIPLYARAGIPEAWLIDLDANTIEVYREPSAEGYKSATTLAADAPASPAAFPDFSFRLKDALGG